MKTKIQRYCDKFLHSNFDKRDRKKSESLKFEWFVNSLHCWSVSSQSYNSKTKIGKEISLGDSLGGDAFFIEVNGTIFTLEDNIDDIITYIKKIKPVINFHFIQTKKSSSAKLGDFKKFVDIPLKLIKKIGISDKQEILKRLEDFIQCIIQDNELNSIEHKFHLYFFTEKNENDIEQLRRDWKNDIEYIQNSYSEYTDVEIHLMGSKHLNSLYEQFISNDYKLFIKKENVKNLPNNSYLIGYITARELLDGIAPSDNDGNRVLYPDVFKNNIRLYLGSTNVNDNIEKTLETEPEKFHLYNNGLTITTKEIKQGNINNFEIKPVNIVNGCQTANSIYNIFRQKADLEDKVKIPVRVIIAEDEEYEKITIRTNSQNGLSERDLLSITNLQKDLQELFERQKFSGKSYYYKRQNSNTQETESNLDFIVTINDILRAAFSTLMLIPHKVSGYFDKTTSKYIENIFDSRFLNLYYTITCIYKLIEDSLEDKYFQHIRLKYHICYLIYKLLNEDKDLVEIEKYFRQRKNIEDLNETEIEDQDRIIKKINSNLYKLNNEIDINDLIVFIIGIIESNYSHLTKLDSKQKERILYKTVDSSQRGEQVFVNFRKYFSLEEFNATNS